MKHAPLDTTTHGIRTTPGRAMPHDRRPIDGVFALVLLTVGVLTVFALSHAGAFFTAPTAKLLPAPTTTVAGVVNAAVREFPMPDANADLMQPAIDGRGNIWFGEMGTNRLGRLDPHTGTVTAWDPPGGRFGIMAVAAAADGTIWFSEQSANYIGSFDPARQRFHTYPLPVRDGRPAAPQDVAIDAHGQVWFTATTSGGIGRINPATGALTMWAVPPTRPGAQVQPFGLAIAPDGNIWFSELVDGAVGRLDPISGRIQLYRAPSADAEIFSIAVGPNGNAWFTELQYGRVGTIDPRTGAIKEFIVPAPVSASPNLYDIAVAHDGTIWFAAMGQNAIGRFISSSQRFTLYELSSPSNIPYGLTLDASGRVWFTAERTPQNYVGLLDV